MGNENSNIRYRSKTRTQSIVVEGLDNFAYPLMPAKNLVESELNEILSQLILEPEKEKLIRAQPVEVKWKVICRHKQVLEQKFETINKAARSPVQIFLEKVQQNPSIQNLEELRKWLSEQAKPEDISSFLAFDGLKVLLDTLESAEVNSKMAKSYHKQIVVLKILENLVIDNNQVVNKLLEGPTGCHIIIANFNPESPEICNSVFEIFNSLCWSSHTEGHNEVIRSFNHLKTMRKFKYPFQPLIDLLQDEKNIVLIENTIAFINTMIESSVDEEERRNIRFQFISCNLRQIYDKIKEKLLSEQYYIDDCVTTYTEETQELTLMKKISAIGKTVFIERDQDEFEKHILQVINQIEVFEKTAEDVGLGSSVEMSESTATHSRRKTGDKIDFTNINTTFEKLKNDAMTNNTFGYLLEILNYMILIPRNEAGQLVWEKMASVFAEATDLETDDWNTKLQEFQTLVKETRNIEELEEFNTNLQSTLVNREEEIEQAINEKNKYQLELNKMQKDTEEIIKKYQQIEVGLEQTASEKDRQIKLQAEEIQKLQSLLKDSQPKDSQQKLESKISDLEKILGEKDLEIRTLEQQKTLNIQANIQPPPNILPPPTNLLPSLNQTSLPPPPPFNLLPNQQEQPQGNPPPPPLNLLGPSIQGNPPPPPNLLGGPPMAPNLLGGPPMAPNLLGGPPMAPNLLGGPPMPPNLLGGPPMPPNLLGGPPPLNLLGKGGPPNLFMPMVSQAVKKVKEKKKPRIPLRGLMWTIVPSANVKETLWEEIDDEKVDLDIDFLEKEFAAKKPAPSVSGGNDPKPILERVKVSLLPPEKTKNMEIVLGKLKMSNSRLRDALEQMDDSVLTINNIESLINIVPTDEELHTVEAFDGDLETLGTPERFALEIGKVPGFRDRLLGVKFVKTCDDLVRELKGKVEKINEILQKIPKDKRFKALAEEVLAIGNYLNGTSARGGAYGFQLDALEKINDIKLTSFPKKNLLMYILERHEKKGNTVIAANEDLSDFELGAKTPLSQLQSDLGELRKGARFLANALKKGEEGDVLGKVKGYFAEPNAKISGIIEEIDGKLKECESNFLNACKYLCENPKDTPSDKLIEKLFKFWTSCKNAKVALDKEQELLRKEEDKKKKDLEKTTLKPGKNLLSTNPTPDQIVETLKNRRQTKRIFAEFANKDEIQPMAVSQRRNLMDEMKEKAQTLEKLQENLVVEGEKPKEKPTEKSKEPTEKHKDQPKESILLNKPKNPEGGLLQIPKIQATNLLPAHLPENNPLRVTIIGKPAPEENKNISPQFKKADVKGGELEAKDGPAKLDIRISMVEGKKAAPIAENRPTLKKVNPPPPVQESSQKNSGGPVDYLSVLKKKPQLLDPKIPAGNNNTNLNYLADILTDGAIKKKSIMTNVPLLPPKQESPSKKK